MPSWLPKRVLAIVASACIVTVIVVVIEQPWNIPYTSRQITHVLHQIGAPPGLSVAVENDNATHYGSISAIAEYNGDGSAESITVWMTDRLRQLGLRSVTPGADTIMAVCGKLSVYVDVYGGGEIYPLVIQVNTGSQSSRHPSVSPDCSADLLGPA